jgi:hypothetical protein
MQMLVLPEKNFPWRNTLAYFFPAIRDEPRKSIAALTPGVNVIKLFSFVTDDEA